MAGMMAKYLATSLAMEKVVSAPRVMSNCLPMPRFNEFGRVAVQINHVAGFLGRLVPVFIATPTSACARAGASFGAVSGHGDQRPRLFCLMYASLSSGSPGPENRRRRLLGDGGGGQRIVAGNHHGANTHGAQLTDALFHAAFDDVFEMDDAEHFAVHGNGERRAAHEMRSEISKDCGHAPPLFDEWRWTRWLPCGAAGPRYRRRSCGLGGEGNEFGFLFRIRGRAAVFSFASTTIERPSGVSSARLESCAASASSSRDSGKCNEFDRLAVAEGEVPVLSRSRVLTSPEASTALPLMARTSCCMTRSMPAMPMAESRPPMVVKMRQTSSETSTAMVGTRAAPEMRRLGVGLQGGDGEQEDEGQASDQNIECDFVGVF